jgi:protein-tyrosine phosphatase
MGEVILRDALAKVPNAAGIEVTSAGTARWHVDEPMDHRAAAALRRAGYEPQATPGIWATADFLQSVDVAIAMTREHRSDLLARRPELAVLLVREVLGHGALDVPDPYFGTDADFDACRETLELATPELIREILRLRDLSA